MSKPDLNPFKQTGKLKFTHQIKSLTPLRDNVIVTDMNFSGRQLSSGIMLLNDDGQTNGIRPRWGRVYAVGPEQKDVVPGQWILIEHGRWSRGLEVEIDGEQFTIRRVDPECMMMVSDEVPQDDTISTALDGEKKERFNPEAYL